LGCFVCWCFVFFFFFVWGWLVLLCLVLVGWVCCVFVCGVLVVGWGAVCLWSWGVFVGDGWMLGSVFWLGVLLCSAL
ncbi:hypothetical protein RA277_32200, partial [Pseudomonas syringae pv. tagetis]